MKKWKIGAGLLALFLCGVIVGAVGTGSFIRMIADSFGDKHRGNPIKMLILKNIEHRLDLDNATMTRIEGDLDVSMAQMDQLRKRLEPQFKAVMNNFIERTSDYLTPEQQKKIEVLMEDFRNHRRDKLKGPGWMLPPPPPPWASSKD